MRINFCCAASHPYFWMDIVWFSGSVTVSILLVLAPAAGWIWLSIPRAVAPVALPSLPLSKNEVVKKINHDRKLMMSYPISETADELTRLFLEKGQSERHPTESLLVYQRRKYRMRFLLKKLRVDHGEYVVGCLRARAVQMMEDALDVKLPLPQARKVLGAFPVYLQRYGATRDGDIVAPRFLVRTMYKSRWNLMMSLEPTDGFAKIELLAHFGWLALHADSAPLPLRLNAAKKYLQVGGERATEGLGVLHYLAGNYPESARYLKEAYRKHRTLRLRNYLLGARKKELALQSHHGGTPPEKRAASQSP